MRADVRATTIEDAIDAVDSNTGSDATQAYRIVRRKMARPYENIPRQGRHRGKAVYEEPTTNVRSQQALHPRADERPARHVATKEPEKIGAKGSEEDLVQILRSDETGQYRLRRLQAEGEAEIPEGFIEVDRKPDRGSMSELLDHLPEQPILVLENTSTGEVLIQAESDLSGGWVGGDFDQVTIFADQSDAEEYADARRA